MNRPILPRDEAFADIPGALPRSGKKPKPEKPRKPFQQSRIKPESTRELAKVLKRCETEFNRRIRARDQFDGKFTCISCGLPFPAHLMEAGHFQRKGQEALRFDPRNVHGQCHRCNCELSGNRAAYRLTMVEMYGEVEVQEIEARKGAGGRLTLDEAHALLRDLLAGKVVV